MCGCDSTIQPVARVWLEGRGTGDLRPLAEQLFGMTGRAVVRQDEGHCLSDGRRSVKEGMAEEMGEVPWIEDSSCAVVEGIVLNSLVEEDISLGSLLVSVLSVGLSSDGMEILRGCLKKYVLFFSVSLDYDCIYTVLSIYRNHYP